MTRIDRRITRGEQRDERCLRLLQVEGRGVIAAGADTVEVPIPGPARVYAEAVWRFAEDHVPGALHVGGGERLAVMPAHSLAQAEGQFFPVFAPRPAAREIGNDRIQAVLRNLLIEQHEIVEDRHHRRDHRNCHFLQDRHAGRTVAVRHVEDAARLLCHGRPGAPNMISAATAAANTARSRSPGESRDPPRNLSGAESWVPASAGTLGIVCARIVIPCHALAF